MTINSPTSEPISTKVKIIFASVVAALLLGLLFLIPLLVSLVIFFSARNYVKRIEWILIGVAAFIITAFTLIASSFAYFNWAVILFTGQGNRMSIPLVAILSIGTLFASIIGLVKHTDILADKLEINSIVSNLTDQVQPHEPPEGKKLLKKIDRVISNVTPSNMSVPPLDIHEAYPISLQAPLGHDNRGNIVYLSEEDLTNHTLVIGTTGSGKTITLEALATIMVEAGWSVIAVDLKEDTSPDGFRNYLKYLSTTNNAQYQQVSLSADTPTHWFDTLNGMTPDSANNAILSPLKFDDGYYQALNKEILGQLITLCYDAYDLYPEGSFRPDRDEGTNASGEPRIRKLPTYAKPDMYQIGKMLKSPSLSADTKIMRADVIAARPERKNSFDSIKNLSTPAEVQIAQGLGSRIVGVYETDAARSIILPSTTNGHVLPALDLSKPGITYLGLDSLRNAELARVVSTNVLLNLANMCSKRLQLGAKDHIAVIIDEASHLENEYLLSLLKKARGANITVVVATQSPADWNEGLEKTWESITGNINSAIIMRQNTLNAQELCADFLGKELKTDYSTQLEDGTETGRTTSSTREERKVSVISLANLETGEAFLKISSKPQRLLWLKIYSKKLNRLPTSRPTTSRPTTTTRSPNNPPTSIPAPPTINKPFNK